MLELIDKYGRVARDLRVSLTDRCNLRCSYCVPEKGIPLIPRRDLLTTQEIIRLVTIAVNQLGITKIRFTGGEPLLRPDLEQIISATPKHVEVALTTNGVGLADRAAALKSAGVHRVNISLDSVDEDEYVKITRRRRFDEAIAGVRAAVRVGLTPVKINAVMMPQISKESALNLVLFALREGVTLRFIEFMPLGPEGHWDKKDVVTSAAMIEHLQTHLRMHPAANEHRGSAPAALWNIEAGTHEGLSYPAGQLGFIGSVSEPFCAACDRTRLTAEGTIRSCLFSDAETDLRTLLRSGASDLDIAQKWREAMWHKPAGHGIDNVDFVHPKRGMSAIGG